MFINCPACRALVATDPATDQPPERCPRCGVALRDVAATVPAGQEAPVPDTSAASPPASDSAGAAAATRSASWATLLSADVSPTRVADASRASTEHRRAGDLEPQVADGSGALPVGTTADDAMATRDGDNVDIIQVAGDETGAPISAADAQSVPVDGDASGSVDPPRARSFAGLLKRLAHPVAATSSASTVASASRNDASRDAGTLTDADRETAPTATPARARARDDAAHGPSSDAPADEYANTHDDEPAPADFMASRDSDDAHAPGSSARAPDMAGDNTLSTSPVSVEPSRSLAEGRTTLLGGTSRADAPPLSPTSSRVADESAPAATHIDEDAVAVAMPAIAIAPPAAGLRTVPSFAHARRSHRVVNGWTTAAALVLLCVILLLQLALADRDRLAADASWRPRIETLCAALRCSVPPWREPAALAILARDVRAVPGRPGLLRISAVFRNDARWAQPLPQVRVTLTDVNGGRVAARDFAPRDYAATADVLAPGQTASMAVDVLEPGARSVAFDFLLH